jgi:lipopolysaccharide heptosyltransferase II
MYFPARVEMSADARARAWARARSVLVIRLDNMGDVLMTTPAIRALKEQTSGRRIVLLASPPGAAVARFIPEIDTVVSYAAPWMPNCPPAAPAAAESLFTTLRRLNLEAAVVFTVYSQSALPAALMATLAGIPHRLAYARENPYGLLSDWVLDLEPHVLVRHEARRQLDLVASVGARTQDESLSFRVSEDDAASARVKLSAAGVDLACPWIVVHPGATAASRRYPTESFAHMIGCLAEERDCQVVMTGGADEVGLATEICRRSDARVTSLAGCLALGELAAVIKASALLIANNTGPIHIAAAVGTPVVDIYALTNPQHAPWRVPSAVLYEDVPCRFCYRSVCPQTHHACLRMLSPDRVAAAARALLAERAEVWDGRTFGLTPAGPTRAAASQP